MSELEQAFARLKFRYERAKKYSKTDQDRCKIDSDLQVLISSYQQYERMLQILLDYSISGTFEDPNYEQMSVDLIILIGQISRWKEYGLDDVDALIWAIRYGCPLQEEVMIMKERNLI